MKNILKPTNNVKSGDRTDSINNLFYLAVESMPKECKKTEKNGPYLTLFVIFIDGRYLAWFIHLKIESTITYRQGQHWWPRSRLLARGWGLLRGPNRRMLRPCEQSSKLNRVNRFRIIDLISYNSLLKSLRRKHSISDPMAGLLQCPRFKIDYLPSYTAIVIIEHRFIASNIIFNAYHATIFESAFKPL